MYSIYVRKAAGKVRSQKGAATTTRSAARNWRARSNTGASKHRMPARASRSFSISGSKGFSASSASGATVSTSASG